MKKIFICAAAIMILFFGGSPCFSGVINWEQTEQVYFAALDSGKRVKTDLPVLAFITEAKNLNQAEKMIRLWILAADTNYRGGILPALGVYMGLFEDKSDGSANNTERRELFLKELNGLLLILNALDEQIRDKKFPISPEMAGKNRSSWNQAHYHGQEIGALEKILSEVEKMPALSPAQMEDFLVRFSGALVQARTACFEED
ncbi:MAG: hypothetical protein PHC85_02345 [Candidatus Pacebacteria bacterium]|nr:hypothetical protein [Candidatus Paceibacterota bacterium]